ncbi:MAG: hypothetical protein ACT4NX_00770 [Deltaproteobacteria bacterium]
MGFTDEDALDFPPAVCEDTYRSADAVRDLGQRAPKFERDDLLRRDFSAVEP